MRGERIERIWFYLVDWGAVELGGLLSGVVLVVGSVRRVLGSVWFCCWLPGVVFR